MILNSTAPRMPREHSFVKLKQLFWAARASARLTDKEAWFWMPLDTLFWIFRLRFWEVPLNMQKSLQKKKKAMTTESS